MTKVTHQKVTYQLLNKDITTTTQQKFDNNKTKKQEQHEN